MSKCYATISGEVIRPKEITTPNGKTITDFGIKIDTQDFKTKEWQTVFMNGVLVGNSGATLTDKTIYEFEGTLDANVYTNKSGEVIKSITLTAFKAKVAEKGNNAAPMKETPTERPKEEPVVEEDDMSDIPF